MSVNVILEKKKKEFKSKGNANLYTMKSVFIANTIHVRHVCVVSGFQ